VQDAIEDASELIKSTNDDFGKTRMELFFFLASILFAVVTTLSIRDRDLLFGSHVQLPVLGLSMSFESFLLGAPLLLLAIHYALLLKFSGLRSKCLSIREAIKRVALRDVAKARNLQRRAGTNFLSQWLISAPEDRYHRHLSSSIYFIVLCFAPLFTFFLITLRTLPLHWPPLTVVQILVLAADVMLLVLFHMEAKREWIWASAAGLVTWLSVSLTFCIPDGFFDKLGRSLWPEKVPFASSDTGRVAFAPTAFLLENRVDNATGRPILFFSRNLVVADDRPLGGSNNAAAQPQTPSWSTSRSQATNLRGRDLRYATLDRSDFRGIDFTLADLTGASLNDADLRGATFGCTAEDFKPMRTLWNRILYSFERRTETRWVDDAAACTELNGIQLNGADLRDVKFVSGQSRKPSLAGVQMRGANLDGLDLSGVDLSLTNLVNASLIGADLSDARFFGANMTGANLTGATLAGTELRLAALTAARLDGAYLVGARFIAADLTRATLIGAELGQAVFYGARLNGAILWASTPPSKVNLAWADLSRTTVKEPDSWQFDWIKTSLQRVRDIQRESVRRRVQNLLSQDRRNERTVERNRVWTRLSAALTRDDADVSYRSALSAIITDSACNIPEVVLAVEFWARPDYGSYDIQPIERARPLAPVDPALARAVDGKFFVPGVEYGVDTYPNTIIPLPVWYDLGGLIEALEHGDCPASKSISGNVVARMKELNTMRTKSVSAR
jgi:uncharacterized protein YjbI with pentapeptide repeats